VLSIKSNDRNSEWLGVNIYRKERTQKILRGQIWNGLM
jgi:hypothetical protein